eukprot:CAMPEP_0203828056 /NCGR_PEP_ID=MMETSP0115-20131106/60421_1 /ASSEMBLY_ACC=CAM_ASM_000227 /TAXON_ID=33651 /ORGANISM="Bicosoecid sp, Strain ms1" /LENGTH=94 /DNA_ID=CAMNT_0050737115 /DNA_START=243 /DNA_END=527 /DNA_ORIENTATION=-
MSDKKTFKLNGAIVKLNQMETVMAERAIDVALRAIKSCNTEKETASAIKAQMEALFPGVWHCFVGRKFGCYVTHESSKFIYFYVGQLGVCLFSS